MALYTYQATKQNGEIVFGEKDVSSYDELASELNKENLMVISIEKKVDVNIGSFFDKIKDFEIGDIPLEEKVIFSRQLATMLSAGLPITQAIEILLQQTKYSRMRNKLAMVYKDIQAGSTLAYSFGKANLIFNELQLSLIEAGEASGNLVEIMQQIADDMKKSASLQGKIKGAMIYPIVIFITIIIVVAILMVFMIPAVSQLYKDFGDAPLPAVTQILVNITNFITNGWGALITFAILAGGYMGFRAFRRTQRGRMLTDEILLKIPVFGSLTAKTEMLRMSRLLGMLVKSGIPIIDALNSTAMSLSTYQFQMTLRKAAIEVAKGVPISIPLAKSKVIPVIAVKLIATGEQTGKLDSILHEIESYYEDQVEEITSNLTKLMEPLILLVAGGVVGFLAVAIYLPIYQLANIIS